MSTSRFAYNNFINRSIGKSHFQIVNDYSPRTPIDLVPLSPHMSVSEPAKNFAKHIHDLHVEIKRKISLSNEEYKLAADVHHRYKDFNVGEYDTPPPPTSGRCAATPQKSPAVTSND